MKKWKKLLVFLLAIMITVGCFPASVMAGDMIDFESYGDGSAFTNQDHIEVKKISTGKTGQKMTVSFVIVNDNTSTDMNNVKVQLVNESIFKEIFEIEDEEILSAMRWHTTGKENMSKLDKVIYIADMIEPNRNFPGVDLLRREAFKDLDNGVIQGLTHTMKYLLNKGIPIDINSIKARNYLLLKE